MKPDNIAHAKASAQRSTIEQLRMVGRADELRRVWGVSIADARRIVDDELRRRGRVLTFADMRFVDPAPVPVDVAFPTLTAGKYGAILADPPWAFLTHSGKSTTPHRCAEDHYRTMGFDALKSLPVGDLAARDCALFMWAVGSHLAESIELAAAWGFTFKTDAFYWLKQRLVDADQIDMLTGDIPEPRIGMGYWTRKQVEPCLLFTRGKPRRLDKGVRQVILEPRTQHSRKPDVAHDRVEKLVAGPYLEMFARRERLGWDIWGDQAPTQRLAK